MVLQALGTVSVIIHLLTVLLGQSVDKLLLMEVTLLVACLQSFSGVQSKLGRANEDTLQESIVSIKQDIEGLMHILP